MEVYNLLLRGALHFLGYFLIGSTIAGVLIKLTGVGPAIEPTMENLIMGLMAVSLAHPPHP